jgi:LCP family protein required for cell wall assembly
VAPRGRRRRAVRVLSWMAAGLSAVILLGSIGVYGLYLHYNGNIKRIALGAHPGGAADVDGSENFLLIGSDSRNGATPAQLKAAGTTLDGGGTNTDVMMVAHIYPGDSGVSVVSIPRDSWVDIPGHGYGKLNSAYSEGGAGLLVSEVQQLTGLHIDHFMMVNFFGFMDISNAVGGVRVCLPQAVNDHNSGLDLPAGYSTIKGSTALAFVRDRDSFATGDLDRIRHEQEFISATLKKAESTGVLLNPFTLNSLLDAVTKSITTDNGLGISDLRNLAQAFHNISPGAVQFATYPIITEAYSPPQAPSVSAVEINEPAGLALFRTIAANQQLIPTAPAKARKPAGSGAAVKLVVPPSAVTVTVLNGTTTGGLARTAATDLGSVGFSVAGVGNAPNQVSETTILYGPNKLNSAQTLQASLPGSVIREDPSLGTQLTVEIGPGFHGAKPVTVSSSPPAAAPSPSPSVATADGVATAANFPCT